MQFDFIIVGSGPAGSFSAYLLSELGKKVAIIERDPLFSKRSICGEIIPEKKYLLEAIDEDESIEETFSLSEQFARNRMRNIIFKIGNKEHRLDYGMMSIDRARLVEYLSNRAMNSGCKFLLGRFSSWLEKQDEVKVRVVTEEGEQFLRGSNLVIAAGASFYREMFNVNDMDMAFALRTIVSGISIDNSVRMEIDPHIAPGGYIWIIPMGNGRANVGLGARLPFISRMNPVLSLRNFIINRFKEFNIEEKEAGRLVPVGGMRKARFGRVFLLGDSAGMCVPINGGGLYTAMISAHVLYRVIRDGVPESYEDILAKTIGKIVNTGLVYRKAADLIVFSDRRIRIASKIVPSFIIRDIIAMKKSFRVYPAMKFLSGVAELCRPI